MALAAAAPPLPPELLFSPGRWIQGAGGGRREGGEGEEVGFLSPLSFSFFLSPCRLCPCVHHRAPDAIHLARRSLDGVDGGKGVAAK